MPGPRLRGCFPSAIHCTYCAEQLHYPAARVAIAIQPREIEIGVRGTAIADILRMLRTTVLTAFLATTVAGCSSSDSDIDELAGDSVGDGHSDGAELVGYYSIVADGKRYKAALVNSTADLTCSDDTKAPSCQVELLVWKGDGIARTELAPYEQKLRAGEELIVQGDFIGTRDIDPDNPKTTFDINDIWVAGSAEGVSAGVFVLARDNGIKCIKAPCPSITETALNANRKANISDIDFGASGADEAAIDAAREQLFEDGVIVSGERFTFTDSGSTGKGRRANQFWTKVALPKTKP